MESRLPDIEKLDRWSYQLAAFGVPLLGLGWLTAAAWSYASWGNLWEGGLKAGWLLVAGLLYMVALHRPRCEKRTAIVAVLGAVAIGMTLLGTGKGLFLISDF